MNFDSNGHLADDGEFWNFLLGRRLPGRRAWGAHKLPTWRHLWPPSDFGHSRDYIQLQRGKHYSEDTWPPYRQAGCEDNHKQKQALEQRGAVEEGCNDWMHY